MASVQKAVTRLSFIGGSLRPKGAIVDVPEEILTPRSDRGGEDDNERPANSNLVDPKGAERMAIAAVAPIAPTGPNPKRPQQLAPGTIETAAGFTLDGVKQVAQGSELERMAAEDGATTTQDAIEEEAPERAFDRDGNGEDGGSKRADPPSLSGKTKAELTEIAEAEGLEIAEGATNAQIIEAIEAKRG